MPLLASASDDGEVVVWSDYVEKGTIPVPKDLAAGATVTALAWSPDEVSGGERLWMALAIARGGRVEIYETYRMQSPKGAARFP
jgi:hypothetical protein